jgi:hypothetical protein
MYIDIARVYFYSQTDIKLTSSNGYKSQKFVSLIDALYFKNVFAPGASIRRNTVYFFSVFLFKCFFIFYNIIQNFFNLCILIHLFLEHEDIINNWSIICLRIIITLIKESKNKDKIVFILK